MPETIGPNEPRLDESAIASQFPSEVVTRALVRDVELPYGAGTMALSRVMQMCLSASRARSAATR